MALWSLFSTALFLKPIVGWAFFKHDMDRTGLDRRLNPPRFAISQRHLFSPDYAQPCRWVDRFLPCGPIPSETMRPVFFSLIRWNGQITMH